MDIAIRQRVLIYWCVFTTLITVGACGALVDRRLPPIDPCGAEVSDLAMDNAGRDLWEGFLEITTHCLEHNELSGCEEFEYAARLSPKNCNIAQQWAEMVCTVIGAPNRMEGRE